MSRNLLGHLIAYVPAVALAVAAGTCDLGRSLVPLLCLCLIAFFVGLIIRDGS